VFDGRLHRNREEQGKQPGNSSATAASSSCHNFHNNSNYDTSTNNDSPSNNDTSTNHEFIIDGRSTKSKNSEREEELGINRPNRSFPISRQGLTMLFAQQTCPLPVQI
jgi:hypothetical protein